MLSTAGVLGADLINIDSSTRERPQAGDGDVLQSKEVKGYDDVMRAANSSLENMDVLLKRLDRIVGFVESGQGSVGKLIYDPSASTTGLTQPSPISRSWWAKSQRPGQPGQAD